LLRLAGGMLNVSVALAMAIFSSGGSMEPNVRSTLPMNQRASEAWVNVGAAGS
jgi:hypothetical protein